MVGGIATDADPDFSPNTSYGVRCSILAASTIIPLGFSSDSRRERLFFILCQSENKLPLKPCTTRASLSKIEYDQQREAAAKLLGCRVSTLDEEVERRREGNAVDEPEFLRDVDPWSEPVNGADLLDTLREMAQRFLVLPRHADDLLALWVVFSHAIDHV